MYNNKELIEFTLKEIIFSLELIKDRFKTIKSVDDFIYTKNGLEKLDSISVRLVAVGEGFKNIDKLTNKKLLVNYPAINWKDVKGIRDVLSHHYFQLDAEIIYETCNKNIDELLLVCKTMLKEL